MQKIYLASGVVIILLLQGCATLSQSECETADWRSIGLEDGSKGRLATWVSKHRKACAEHGVTPDLEQYRLGHAEGLVHFCTPQNGFVQGNSGYGYSGACPPEMRGGFLIAYEQGRELYLLRRDIRQLHNEAVAAERELDELADEITRLEAQLVSGDGSTAQRQAWINALKQLQFESGSLDSLIHDLEIEAARKQGEYDLLYSQSRY